MPITPVQFPSDCLMPKSFLQSTNIILNWNISDNVFNNSNSIPDWWLWSIFVYGNVYTENKKSKDYLFKKKKLSPTLVYAILSVWFKSNDFILKMFKFFYVSNSFCCCCCNR